MASGGVFSYAEINARVRGMVSALLGSQEWSELIKASDFNSLIGLLRRTRYGPYLLRVEDKDLTPRRAVYQIKSHMTDVFLILLRTAPKVTHPLLTLLYRNYEVENLKAVLRGIVSRSPWERVRDVLFPLNSLSNLPAQAMVETGNVEEAVELLRGSPYYTTLSHALTRFTSEQSLFPLEVALDLSYWREVWASINQLPKLDREHALTIVGSLLDMNNLMWAIRYRVYYNLSEEELINYTLPFGYQLQDADVRAIAAGADIPQVALHVYPRLVELDEYLRVPREGLPLLEIQLQRAVAEQCRKAFIGYPFHIGVPLAFLTLKRMEIQDLTVLIEVKSSHTPIDDYRRFLLLGYAAK